MQNKDKKDNVFPFDMLLLNLLGLASMELDEVVRSSSRYLEEHHQIQNWSIEEWHWRFKLKNKIKELIKLFYIKKIMIKSFEFLMAIKCYNYIINAKPYEKINKAKKIKVLRIFISLVISELDWELTYRKSSTMWICNLRTELFSSAIKVFFDYSL